MFCALTAPVPGVVLHNSVRVQLDPEVEAYEDDARDPASGGHGNALAVRLVATHNGKQAVRDKVTHEDQVHHTAEDEPGVVLDRGAGHLVVLGDLGLQFVLEQLVEPRTRVLTGGGVLKELHPPSPRHHELVVGLDGQQIADPDVVRGSPEKEDEGEDGAFEARGQGVCGPDVEGEDGENQDIGEVLGFARV